MAADDLPITVDRTSAAPLSVQVATALRNAALAGHLRADDRLPSTRSLATRLGVSRTVTATAYDQLHAEGWIAGARGSGTFVTASPATSPTPEPPAVRIDAFDPLIDLAPGSPSIEAVDTTAWRRAWRAAGTTAPMRRPERAGWPEYRTAVAEHLLRHRGFVDAAVLATAGTSAAVAEIATATMTFGDCVAIENPGYGRAVGALSSAGMTVVPVPVDEHGICVDAIPSGVRAVYCTPAHQYPLGARMPAARRVALVERARRENWLVLEDDYDSELRYDAAPLPLLATIGPDVVVHLGTTSKILSPTLGVGWLAAPPHVTELVLAHRTSTGIGPAITGQLVLAEFARTGDLARHLRRLRRHVSARRTAVVEALRAATIPTIGDDAGAHLVIPLPTASHERTVVAEGELLGLRLDGLARHHIGTPAHFGIALGYTACTEIQLDTALPLLVGLLTG